MPVKQTPILPKISGIRGVTWQWNANARSRRKTPGAADAGVIAQEVEARIPELVVTIDGIKHVNYAGLVGVLVEAVKELKLAHDALAHRVATLERRRRISRSGRPRQGESR